MHLLNTKTYKLSEYQGDIPRYAILSHVWGKEEVTFKDISDLDRAKKMQGFAKIEGACSIARKHGLNSIWIDTCCINKESSTELSEAINSMYMWYANARVCYAYLEDVSGKGDRKYPSALFVMSRWFSRGWTLQELIAPSRVVFYEANWVNIGTKSSLQETISDITGISREAITGSLVLDDVPIAVKMSWAADRNTTREEDIAYSLMGLFGINMPLLYGEGRKAFIRLQHEIIKKSDDHSIFAWTSPGGGHRGILAHSPSEFRDSGGIERIFANTSPPFSTPHSITNQGLHIELPIKESEDAEASKVVFLNCRFAGTSEPIVITLVQHHSLQPNKYVRSNFESLEWKAPWYERKVPTETFPLFIADDYAGDNSSINNRRTLAKGFRMRVKVPAEYGKPLIRPIRLERAEDRDEDEDEFEYDFGHGHGHGDEDDDEDGDKDEDRDGDYDIWVYKDGSSKTPFGVLVLEEPCRTEKFTVLVGLRGDTIWCDVLTETNPEDKDGWERLDRFGYWSDTWIPQRTFRDIASADLNDGWSIVVSPGITEYVTLAGIYEDVNVEIKKSPKPRSLIKRPEWKVACLVVPPAPKHGFTVVDQSGFQQTPSTTTWVQHLDTFVLYMNERSMGAGALTFRRNESGEEFTLFVRTCRRGAYSYRWDKIFFEVEGGRDDLEIFLKKPVKTNGLVQEWPEMSDCRAWDENLEDLKGSVVAKLQPLRDVADYRIDISYSSEPCDGPS